MTAVIVGCLLLGGIVGFCLGVSWAYEQMEARRE